jgi:hypothetical protein
LIGVNNFYNDLVFSVDSGPGEGQRRVIKSYTYSAGGNYGNVVLDYPLTVGLSADTSKFSIVPNIQIDGDGYARENYLNKFKEADITVKFGPGLTTNRDTCTTTNIYNQTLIDSFEMVDTGTDYTRAEFKMIKGLTFTAGFTGIGDINDVANIVISPPGGHGSNAVRELGAAALMVVLDFNQDERKKLSVNNDYRQFGIVKNPLLKKPQTRIRFEEWGLTGSFVVGASLVQGKTGSGGGTGFDNSTGKIISWDNGVSGYYATSELIVESVTSGNFACDGIVSSTTGAVSSGNFTIANIDQRTVAGTEGREILRLKVSPASSATGAEFMGSGLDFRPGMYINSIGNKTNNISNSRFKKRVSHGLLPVSFFSGIFGSRLPGPGCLYVSQSVEFKRPIYIEETVTAVVEVLEVCHSSRHVKFKTTCEVGGRVVIDGLADIFLPKEIKI